MTTKKKLLQTIRENCIRCLVGQISEIDNCGGDTSCVLFPYRRGIDPTPSRRGNPEALKKALKAKEEKSSLQRAKAPAELNKPLQADEMLAKPKKRKPEK
jgi:hypothetical protein